MIKLQVDEAYAFDYLAILEVKNHSKDCHDAITRCIKDIIDAIGLNKFNQVHSSIAYKELVDANQNTFNAVEQARYGEISAKDVDATNSVRFQCKQKIQSIFFNGKLTEQKT